MAKHSKSCPLPAVLTSAFLEWMLMLVMFLDAFLSYTLRKFASFSHLQPPCLMCSRMKVFSNKKQTSQWDLLCDAHKSDISSLAFCSIHSKLTNSFEMCGNCTLLITAENKSNPEMIKLLASDTSRLKSELDSEDNLKIPLLKKICSCCSEAFSKRPNANNLIKNKSGNIAHPFKNRCADCMAHVPYRKLRITSDSESEVPVSDDDDANVVVRGVVELKEIVPGEKLIDLAPTYPETSCVDPQKQVTDGTHEAPSSSAIPNAAIGHGLEELKWNQYKVRASPPKQLEAALELVSRETSQKGSSEPGDYTSLSSTSNGDTIKTVNLTGRSLKMIRTLNDNYNFSVGRGLVPSPTFSDLVKGKDSARYHEDLKQKLSQISTFSGFEIPWSDTSPSPRVSDNGGLTKRQSEPCLESLDGSVITGENEVDRLKCQVELDSKSMSDLYKELEEERSASAIAANQAMAMINRLQEEKAAMQMEALQYLRMMEEQAEYDQEALQKTNDLLSEREKEIQDLEAEIECYHKRFGEEIMSEGFLQRCDSNSRRNRSFTDTPKRSRSFKFSIINFEDEKAYISEYLKKLEKKVQEVSSTANSDSTNQASDHKCDENQDTLVRDEIAYLSKRLEALEADTDFLQHIVNNLRNGEGGIQVIQEIVHTLRELHEVIRKG